jgi:5-methylcytosine-specific restriction endonuclease McrA
MVDLNSERRQYRRTRRNRKTRYRKSRFLNRRKPAGWLAPSIEHKLDSHKKVIDQVCRLLPVSQIVVEVASFDIQKIKNPAVSDFAYQMGEQLGYQNVRQYVIERDSRQCQGKKGCKSDRWEVHHLLSRKSGGDRPENLILLCAQCHALHHAGKLTLKVRQPQGFKAESFMSMVRWRLIEQLRELYHIPVNATFGYITKFKRNALALEKSHSTDAFVIAGGATQSRSDTRYFQQQVRKQNRKLFKGAHSHLKNTAPRFVHGFQRFDKVLFQQTECFIFGRRNTGYFDLRTLDGTKVHASAKAKELRLLEFASTLLIERKIAI